MISPPRSAKWRRKQDQYYLLSYTPTVDSAEGSCHELKVKVDRGDLEIRARKSYCTSKPADLLSGKHAGTALEARAASAAPGNIAAKMQLPLVLQRAQRRACVNIAMEITPPAMKFQKEKRGKLSWRIRPCRLLCIQSRRNPRRACQRCREARLRHPAAGGRISPRPLPLREPVRSCARPI